MNSADNTVKIVYITDRPQHDRECEMMAEVGYIFGTVATVFDMIRDRALDDSGYPEDAAEIAAVCELAGLAMRRCKEGHGLVLSNMSRELRRFAKRDALDGKEDAPCHCQSDNYL